MGEKEFKEILETKLFSSVEDAMWRNVRNFLSNLMFHPNCKIGEFITSYSLMSISVLLSKW